MIDKMICSFEIQRRIGEFCHFGWELNIFYIYIPLLFLLWKFNALSRMEQKWVNYSKYSNTVRF